jgi:DNA-3-methyladenine glycosylase II
MLQTASRAARTGSPARRGRPTHPGGGVWLAPCPPFDFARTLRFILSPPPANGRTYAPLLDYFEEGEYRRVLRVGEQAILYGVSEVWAPKRSELRVRVLSGATDEQTLAAVVAQVKRQFSTDLDLAPFYRLAKQDRVLSRLVDHFLGMRVPQAPDVFETLICAILEQQVNLSFAHQVKRALIERYGVAVEYQGRRYNAFPEPAALAITTPRELLRLQISGPKARYIIGIAQAVLDGTLDLEALRQLEPAAAQAKLRAHKGVGPWTAQYVGLRALGHLDCLPAADVGLQRAIQHLYGLRKQPTAARVEKLAKAWAGWRSYATFYLWLTYWEEPGWKQNLIEELRRERAGGRRRA